MHAVPPVESRGRSTSYSKGAKSQSLRMEVPQWGSGAKYPRIRGKMLNYCRNFNINDGMSDSFKATKMGGLAENWGRRLCQC